MDEEELETRISEILQEHSDGVENSKLVQCIPGVDAKSIVTVINRIIAKGKIGLGQKGNKKEIVYIWKKEDPNQDGKSALLGDNVEKAVYEMIGTSGNKGIWMRDIREKCSLSMPLMKKAIKNLETKKLIKSVKSVSNARQKFYMLYDMEPHQSLTGGIFYTGHEHDTEFVDILNQHCCQFLREKSVAAKKNFQDALTQKNAAYASVQEVWDYIKEIKICTVELSFSDLEQVLETLFYDGTAEKKKSMNGFLYKATESTIDSTGIVRMPCGVCPVIEQCHEGGIVSPSTCPYMQEWLSF